MCAGHFYFATLFLAMKEACQASLHVEKCVEIRKMIFPDCHRKIREGEIHVIHSVFIERLLLLSVLFLAECLKQDIRGLKENTFD